MKQKAIRRERKRIMALIRKWRNPLGLTMWRIDSRFLDHPPQKPHRKEKGTHTVASASVWWEYCEACLSWNCRATQTKSEAELERIVVHELLHIKVNEMRHFDQSDGIYHEERVVSELAEAVFWIAEAAKGGDV